MNVENVGTTIGAEYVRSHENLADLFSKNFGSKAINKHDEKSLVDEMH